MPDMVNVRSTESIEEFRVALLRLRDDARESVVTARLAVRVEREWLAERQQHWQRRVTSLAEELIEAEAALARCRSRRRSGGSDGCQAIADWGNRTRRALWEAENELRNVRHWIAVIDTHIAGFEQRARLLTLELSQRVPLASAELTRVSELLTEYAGN